MKVKTRISKLPLGVPSNVTPLIQSSVNGMTPATALDTVRARNARGSENMLSDVEARM